MSSPASLPRPGRRFLPPVLSALLLVLTFHPFRFDWLIWVALVPLLVWLADPGVSRAQATAGLLGVGTAYHLSLLVPLLSIGWWAWGASTEQGVRAYFAYARVFMTVLVTLIAVWGGVVFAWLGGLMRPWMARPAWAVWVVPSIWIVLLEYAGHRTVFGFSWGLIGNRVHDQEPIRQAASAVGVYGLGFLVIMVNVCLAALWGHRRPRARQRAAFPCHPARRGSRLGQPSARRPAARATLMTGLVLGLALAYGMGRLRGAQPHGTAVPVALLQASRTAYAVEDFDADGLDRLYGSMLRQSVEAGARLVVMPETIWLRTLQLDDTTYPWASELVSAGAMHHALLKRLPDGPWTVLFGIDAVREGRAHNVTAAWNPQGFLGVYAKQRLVPFAEYRPALVGWLAPQNVLHGSQFAFAPGHGPQLIRAGGLVFGSFICQEVLFPGLIRRSVVSGAELLVTTGNDGVFTSPSVAREQAALAQLRAIETGRYVLRAMKTGISAIIDPHGRVLAHAPLNARAIVAGAVHPRTERTLWVRWGDWIILPCALLLLATVPWSARRRPR